MHVRDRIVHAKSSGFRHAWPENVAPLCHSGGGPSGRGRGRGGGVIDMGRGGVGEPTSARHARGYFVASRLHYYYKVGAIVFVDRRLIVIRMKEL